MLVAFVTNRFKDKKESVIFLSNRLIVVIASSRQSFNWLDTRQNIHTCGARMDVFFSSSSFPSVGVECVRYECACVWVCTYRSLCLSLFHSNATFKCENSTARKEISGLVFVRVCMIETESRMYINSCISVIETLWVQNGVCVKYIELVRFGFFNVNFLKKNSVLSQLKEERKKYFHIEINLCATLTQIKFNKRQIVFRFTFRWIKIERILNIFWHFFSQ